MSLEEEGGPFLAVQREIDDPDPIRDLLAAREHHRALPRRIEAELLDHRGRQHRVHRARVDDQIQYEAPLGVDWIAQRRRNREEPHARKLPRAHRGENVQ